MSTFRLPSAAQMDATIIDFARHRPYRTPQSTEDAFLYVVRNYEVDYIKRWLDDHPRDREHLIALWERKAAVQS